MSSGNFEGDVLVLAFRDPGVLAKYVERLDPLFFQNQVYGNLWLLMRRMFSEYRQGPSLPALSAEIEKELRRESGLKLFNTEDIPVISELLSRMSNSDYYVMDRWVADQLDQWIATRAYRVATARAEQELAAGNPQAIPGIFRAATAVASSGNEQPRDFVDRMEEIAEAQKQDIDRTLSTGLRKLDGVTGGLLMGEFGLIFGVDSVGKSFLATHIGAHNTKEGVRVLHITNELSVVNQERRYVAWYTQIPKRSLWERSSTINPKYYEHLRGKLDVRYLPPGSTVNDVWGILEAARQEGNPFKLVIIDYIDQFNPAAKVEAKEYLRLIQISSEFSALAKPEANGGQDVCILAITHADSSAYNKKWGDGSMMGGSKIGKNKVIDFGIFLGQDQDMIRQGIVAVSITKIRERAGKGGRCFLRQEFDLSRFSDVDESEVAPQLETPSLS